MSPQKKLRKLTRKTFSLDEKREIIAKKDAGARVVDLASLYGVNKSSISTIIANRDKIVSVSVAKGVSRFHSVHQRNSVLDEVEKLLLIWIRERELRRDLTPGDLVREKARQLYKDLVAKCPAASIEDGKPFQASRGWFRRFKIRSGVHGVTCHGEAASADVEAAQNFVKEFQKFVDEENYLPQQVFNCDETGLFWKKMPKRSFLTQEEKSLPGRKPMKNRLTLLIGANAAGDFKLKPLLVYNSENPRAFKAKRVNKRTLPVLWRSNKKAWVTQAIFKDWVTKVFAPSVEIYLKEANLPRKALLVLDNAPGHPQDLETVLAQQYDFITVRYLPPNTTSVLQPMDQNVIANFKALYTRDLFRLFLGFSESSPRTDLRSFWRDDFDICEALKLIEKAWAGISQRCLVAAWKCLWPHLSNSGIGEGEVSDEEKEYDDAVQEIVSVAEELGLNVDENDVEELLEEQEMQEDPTTEDLQAMLNQEDADGDTSEDEDGAPLNPMSSTDAKLVLSKWEEIKNLMSVCEIPLEVQRSADLFENCAIAHFKELLKSRERQTTLDRFIQKITRK